MSTKQKDIPNGRNAIKEPISEDKAELSWYNVERIGEDKTPKVLDGMSSPVIMTYVPIHKWFEVVLLQGTPAVGIASDNTKMAIKWNTLYGYYADSPMFKDFGTTVEDKFKWEKNPFSMAFSVYNDVLKELEGNDPDTGQPLMPQSLLTADSADWVEMTIEELTKVNHLIWRKLNRKYPIAMKFKGEEQGHYRWIGNRTRKNASQEWAPLVDIMKIPKFINDKDLTLFGSQIPYQPDSDKPITPFDDTYQEAIICGLMHGFEAQKLWRDSCAIRAAFTSFVFAGNLSTEKVLSAAARKGMRPRMASQVIGPPAGPGGWFFKRLVALGIAYEWIRETYKDIQWQRRQGQVRFTFRAEGVSQLVQNEIAAYVCEGMLRVPGAPQNAGTGLFFWPSKNGFGLEYQLTFCQVCEDIKNGAMEILPHIGSPQEWEYSPEPLQQSASGTQILNDNQQLAFTAHPLKSEPIEQILDIVEYAGAGIYSRKKVIRDKLDWTQAYQPSALVKMLLLGWDPAYPPSYVLPQSATRGTSKLQDFQSVGYIEGGIPFVPGEPKPSK